MKHMTLPLMPTKDQLRKSADPLLAQIYLLHKTKKRHNSLRYNLLCRYELRRQDSNMRPPGYEPGELPTAPLRDINHVSEALF